MEYRDIDPLQVKFEKKENNFLQCKLKTFSMHQGYTSLPPKLYSSSNVPGNKRTTLQILF